MPRFEKGSEAAKQHMAHLRSLRKPKQEVVGAGGRASRQIQPAQPAPTFHQYVNQRQRISQNRNNPRVAPEPAPAPAPAPARSAEARYWEATRPEETRPAMPAHSGRKTKGRK